MTSGFGNKRGASTGRGGKGNEMIFPVSHFDQRIGSRALIPPAPF